VNTKGYLTIGEVVERLQISYPDLSISKVRFLEEEGLIAPQRTAGGYRKFSQADLGRLEMILRLQRNHFLPLAVIGEKLAEYDHGRVPSELQQTPVGATEPLPFGGVEEGPIALDDVPGSLGIPVSFIRGLVGFGVVELAKQDGKELLKRADVTSVHAAWDLHRFGIEPRHLRMYVMAADREATLFEQILIPTYRHRSAETKLKLDEALTELTSISEQLKTRLLMRALERVFEELS